MSLNHTPRSNRLHIGIFGRRNSGKSSLINAITNQNVAIVSDVAGTTADPVYKAMEIHGIGACVIIDTAGFDDEGKLGLLRVEKTRQASEKTDIAIVVFTQECISRELEWIKLFKEKKTPCIAVINKVDVLDNIDKIASEIKKETGLNPFLVSTKTENGKKGIEKIRNELIRLLPEDYDKKSITGNLANENDTILLVMPQDIQAPKGRLILPQVQTLRELLDKGCTAICTTLDKFDNAIMNLKEPPNLIITDSQIFKQVYEKKPSSSKLTSFSVLFAGYKGDISFFSECASAIELLTEKSKVLIAEACTHAPLAEDIGREKIPAMLRKKIGTGLHIDVVSGNDFPNDLSPYDLVIHCGACMFNRKYVMSKINSAKSQNVPMTNYGITIAYLAGILDNIDIP